MVDPSHSPHMTILDTMLIAKLRENFCMCHAAWLQPQGGIKVDPSRVSES